MKKLILNLSCAVAVTLAVVLGVQYGKQEAFQRGLAEKILRFHVRANSDSEEDQAVKCEVRDAVGALLGERMREAVDLAESEAVIRASLDEVEATAEAVLAEAGCTYGAAARLAMVEFPVKTYGDYTFPAGTYEALEVRLGDGAGQNWWCVMYPNMCFSGSVYEVVDENAKESLQKTLTAEEYRKVFSEGNYEVRFRYLPFLDNLLTE